MMRVPLHEFNATSPVSRGNNRLISFFCSCFSLWYNVKFWLLCSLPFFFEGCVPFGFLVSSKPLETDYGV